MIFRRPPALVREPRIIPGSGKRPCAAVAPHSAPVAAPHAGLPVNCRPGYPARLWPISRRLGVAGETPRASGLGALGPLPAPRAPPKNMHPAATCVRGRYLVCPISAAANVSLHEC